MFRLLQKLLLQFDKLTYIVFPHIQIQFLLAQSTKSTASVFMGNEFQTKKFITLYLDEKNHQ